MDKIITYRDLIKKFLVGISILSTVTLTLMKKLNVWLMILETTT